MGRDEGKLSWSDHSHHQNGEEIETSRHRFFHCVRAVIRRNADLSSQAGCEGSRDPQPRDVCCEPLAVGVLPLVLLGLGIRNHDVPKDAIPMIIIASPVIVGMAAVTGPPLLIIEGIRRLKPAKILYRVVP
jgi:hypothetical protein